MKKEDLKRSELLSLIDSYDQYIKDICEDKQNVINKYPVCVNEFLNNEFLENHNDINEEQSYEEKAQELADEILDIFDELLMSNDISIPDKQREGNSDEAALFGDTYYSLENSIKDLIERLA